MKIIGHGQGEELVVNMTITEVARVCGYNSDYSEDFRKQMEVIGARRDGRLCIGVEIPVSDFWNRLQAIRAKQRELDKMAGTMRALADVMSQASPAAIVPEATKD